MNLTKYEHACFSVEKEGQLLVVDPGEWTKSLGSPTNVTAIVVTHEHPDHYDVATLKNLIDHNPNAIIYSHKNITRQLDDTLPSYPVKSGQAISTGPFNLEFFGGQHAIIHESFPQITNLAVMINDTIYYPGDSLIAPNREVNILALPVAAPWLKIAEVIDFVAKIKPKVAFPTHDAILSEEGQLLIDRMLPKFVENSGGTYKRLISPLVVNE